MDHSRTPLFHALLEHVNKKTIPFHIPGHKKGKGMDPEFSAFIGENALSIDLINIAPLDDLHQPIGVIAEAQSLAADAFGADYTFFSVQGTSGAIMTMIMAVCNEGDKIIVPRNVHKSVLSAIIFVGAKPVFLSPARDSSYGIDHGITIRSLKKALEKHPDAKAVLVINPTYFGVCTDLQEVVNLVHRYNIPVIVDEAHGALIHFHDQLPMSAMQAGADMAATSTHKLGGSMTQSSILNVKGSRINPQRIQSFMSMLTTTSTSYILLASLDTARRYLALHGYESAAHAIKLATYARTQINQIPNLVCMGEEILGTDATHGFDCTKLCIHLRKLGITGYDAENWLRENHRIEVELSDMYNILCLVTPGDTEETIDLLITALRELAQTHQHLHSIEPISIKVPSIPQLTLTPRDAFFGETEVIPFQQASDRIIAEFIYVYPPGIPILLPGEVVTQELINFITEHVAVGLPVKGPEDRTVQNIKVIVETQPIFE